MKPYIGSDPPSTSRKDETGGAWARTRPAVIFAVRRPLVMTRQRVLAGTAATADLGAFPVGRWADQRRVGVSTGWRGARRRRVGRSRSLGVSPMSQRAAFGRRERRGR